MDNMTLSRFESILRDNFAFEKFKEKSEYFFKGNRVPRVTEIIQNTFHEDYIAHWANWLGFHKKSYEKELSHAADVGTCTHAFIENFCQEKPTQEVTMEEVNNCISGFIRWWDEITSCNEVEVVGQEQTLTCPWFGGTYDMLIRINGKYYLIDFKTSSKVSVRYYMQLAAYRYMIEPSYAIKLSGVIILRFSKKTPGFFEESFVNLEEPDGLQFIEWCTMAFFSCLSTYNFRRKIESYDLNEFISKGDKSK